jgi:hypothetical protein
MRLLAGAALFIAIALPALAVAPQDRAPVTAPAAPKKVEPDEANLRRTATT